MRTSISVYHFKIYRLYKIFSNVMDWIVLIPKSATGSSLIIGTVHFIRVRQIDIAATILLPGAVCSTCVGSSHQPALGSPQCTRQHHGPMHCAAWCIPPATGCQKWKLLRENLRRWVKDRWFTACCQGTRLCQFDSIITGQFCAVVTATLYQT